MVVIKEKKIGTQTYYYLEQSIRNKNKIQKKEQYLGKELPKNLEEIKKEFLAEIYRERWFGLFEKIKDNFSREEKVMPAVAKAKETEKFMIKFTYDTNRIEGSTLTLRETANLLEKGITPARPLEDVKEAEAHKEVFYEMLRYQKDLSLQTILAWHKKLLERTKLEIAGKIRKHQVAISGSRFLPPSPVEVNLLLEDFFRWYHQAKKKLPPVELAALVHLKLVTIHPFADGNGRLSRLVMNFALHKNKYPLLSIPYENRNSYYRALERAQIKRKEEIFLQWFFKRYLKEQKRYLKS